MLPFSKTAGLVLLVSLFHRGEPRQQSAKDCHYIHLYASDLLAQRLHPLAGCIAQSRPVCPAHHRSQQLLTAPTACVPPSPAPLSPIGLRELSGSSEMMRSTSGST